MSLESQQPLEHAVECRDGLHNIPVLHDLPFFQTEDINNLTADFRFGGVSLGAASLVGAPVPGVPVASDCVMTKSPSAKTRFTS
jgi:hypothetical protein